MLIHVENKLVDGKNKRSTTEKNGHFAEATPLHTGISNDGIEQYGSNESFNR